VPVCGKDGMPTAYPEVGTLEPLPWGWQVSSSWVSFL